SGCLLAVEHQAIDKLASEQRLVPRVAFELRATGGDSSHESTLCARLIVCEGEIRCGAEAHGRRLFLRTVTTAGLLAAFHTQCIAGASNDLISHARQVANSTTTDQHDRVFLQIVSLTGN